MEVWTKTDLFRLTLVGDRRKVLNTVLNSILVESLVYDLGLRLNSSISLYLALIRVQTEF